MSAGVAKGTTFLRNLSDATLTIFPATDTGNGVGVVVAPGGGWTINAWTHEGRAVASWLADAGYTAFLLKYRVQASVADQAAFEARQAADLVATDEYLQARAAAADDGRRAISIVREHSARFGLHRPDLRR